MNRIHTGRLIVIVLALIAFTMPAQAQTGGTFSASPNIAIPDQGGPVFSSITIPNGIAIENIVVSVNITHTHSSDLRIRLTHNGQQVSLMSGLGSATCSADGLNVTFADIAAQGLSSYDCANTNATVSGLWRPEGSLNTFVGMDAGGVWELAVQDVVVSDSGTLRSWAITLNTTDPTSVNIGGITVPNYGEVMIRESDPVVARIHPNGQIIRGVNAQEMWLPRDFDENGFDTYVVAEVTRANDDEVWLGLFLGSSQWGWVRMADVIPTKYIIGSE